MIRFSALLVAVAVGLLVAGVVTSKLMLVYVAIAVSGVALLALAIGALVKRKELFGPSTSAEPQLARPEPAAVHVSPGPPAPQAVPWGAAVPVASTWLATAPQPQPQPQPQPTWAETVGLGERHPRPDRAPDRTSSRPPSRPPSRASGRRSAPPGRVHAPPSGRPALARPRGPVTQPERVGVAPRCSRHPGDAPQRRSTRSGKPG